ncbi:MAG TPA: NUDIX hydrolase [Patescibacteria group bacterium]|nr:NUDIX hydrolase [Patescibacteria group bacterium]
MIRPIILANCLVKDNGKYLLVQEATDKVYGHINTHSKGKWTFPHGEVNKEESVAEAAKRELVEETGGKTNIVRLGTVVQGTLNNTIYLLSFVFYGEGFERLGNRLEEEIKTVEWFTLEEILDLEKQGLARDNVPLSKIIQAVEENNGVKFIEWIWPDYVLDIFRLLEQGSTTKELKK